MARAHAGQLAHVTDWVFDLDNTLYPAHCDLFAQIDARMTDFVARFLRVDHAEARGLQKQYYAEHGTTLKGLMTLHGMAPAEFLAHVHEIDLTLLPRCELLRGAIAGLPGRKFVYTNGSRRHAERVGAQPLEVLDRVRRVTPLRERDQWRRPNDDAALVRFWRSSCQMTIVSRDGYGRGSRFEATLTH